MPLDAQTLNKLRDTFFARCKFPLAPDPEPSGHLLSKVANQMRYRLLQVFPVWMVRSLTHQGMADAKRRRVGDGLNIVSENIEEEARVTHNTQIYVRLLHILLLVYARVGCNKLVKLPSRACQVAPERRSSDAALYVHVPLDILLCYHGRASKTIGGMPAAAPLDWLEKRDTEERTTWVEKFRASEVRPLGQVIAEVYNQREAMWQPPLRTVGNTEHRQQGYPRTIINAQETKHASSSVGSAKRFEAKHRGQFRSVWNQGTCKDPCPQYLVHACSNPVDKEKTEFCGMYNHKASQCRRMSF